MSKKNETASFMLRFTQKVWHDEQGENQVQWRGTIRHVQSGEEHRFVDFSEALSFIQESLSKLTLDLAEDKSPQEKDDILSKSYHFWKDFAMGYIDTLSNPLEQLNKFRKQIDQEVGQSLNPDTWKPSTKADAHNILLQLSQIQEQIQGLTNQMKSLENQLKSQS
ncbi:MAG: hypothetical protein NW226_07865 [Microscillaceae bacterium]|nr:hypothetical protein [Microscillaceae bacterium]